MNLEFHVNFISLRVQPLVKIHVERRVAECKGKGWGDEIFYAEFWAQSERETLNFICKTENELFTFLVFLFFPLLVFSLLTAVWSMMEVLLSKLLNDNSHFSFTLQGEAWDGEEEGKARWEAHKKDFRRRVQPASAIRRVGNKAKQTANFTATRSYDFMMMMMVMTVVVNCEWGMWTAMKNKQTFHVRPS